MKNIYLFLNTFLFLGMISCGQNTELANPKKNNSIIGREGKDSIIIDHRLDSCKKIAQINLTKYELISSCDDLILSKSVFLKSRYEVREVKVCILKYKKHPDLLKISLTGEIENYRRLTAKWSTYKVNITGLPEINNSKKIVLKNEDQENKIISYVNYNKITHTLRIKQKNLKNKKTLRSFSVKCHH